MAPVATPVQNPVQQTIKEITKPQEDLVQLPKKQLDRIWRGDTQGVIHMPGIPDFQGDKYAERQWIKEHMVLCFSCSFLHLSLSTGCWFPLLG